MKVILFTLVSTSEPDPVVDSSVPCCDSGGCCDHGGPGGDGGGTTGPIELPTSTQWFPVCAGGGVVPTQADLTHAENWAA